MRLRLSGLLILIFLKLSLRADDPKLISLYPVPLKSSRLYVQFPTGISNIHSVEIRNLIGRKIQEKNPQSGQAELAFDDMDAQPNGVYVVVAKDKRGQVLEITKFILNR